MKSNYGFRQIILENEKALDQAIRNIELMRLQEHSMDVIRYIEKYYDGKLEEQPEDAIKKLSCELIEYLLLIQKSIYEGIALSNDEWNYVNDYLLARDVDADLALKKEARKRIKAYVNFKYKNYLEHPLDYIENQLSIIKNSLAKVIKEYANSREAQREEHYKEILKKESNNVTNNLVSVFDIDKRVLYSIQYNIMKYDIENEKSESKAQQKLAYLYRWKKYICDFQRVNTFSYSYFIDNDEVLSNEIRKATHNCEENPKNIILLAECLLFEPYNSFQSESNQSSYKLKLSSDYIHDIICNKYNLFSQEKVKQVRSQIKSNIKRMNNTNEKMAFAIVSSVLITAATGGLASTFAPAIAIALVGESFVGLSGAALTSASLAFLGGGSLAVGGLGMAGGAAAITSGGAILGAMSGAPAIALASVLVDGICLNSCIKLITICNILSSRNNYDNSKTISDIISICNEHISSNNNYLEIVKETIKFLEEPMDNNDKISKLETKQKIDEFKKVKKNIEKNIKYYEKARKIINEDCEKAKIKTKKESKKWEKIIKSK